jgi:putative DNA primase/helicase
VPVDRQDRDLEDKLRAEQDGILWWALEGCRAYLAEGLGTCAAVEDATREYREDEDYFGRYLEDRCVVAAGISLSKDAFLRDLNQWLEDNNMRPMSPKAIKVELVRRGIGEGRDGRSGPRVWLGVALREREGRDRGWQDTH